MELIWSPPHGAMMSLAFLTLPLKYRAQGCPILHLPSTSSSDNGYAFVFLHLDVPLSINHTCVVHNILESVTILQKIYKHKKYQLPSPFAL